MRCWALAPLVCAAAADSGLDAINQYRKTNGKAALTECPTDAKAQAIAEYDAKNGKHAYNKANGWDGVCPQDVGGQCETNQGLTWADAVGSMGASCNTQVLGDMKCAAFGHCTGCSTSASGKTRDFFVANFCKASSVNGTGLDAINAFRAAKGKAALTACDTDAKAKEIVDYDAANGAGAYVGKNGWDGVCAADFVGKEEQCETNGYNGGDDGLTWAAAVKAMETSCPDALLGNHKCAAFGYCEGCTKSKSGKLRNFYTSNFC